MAKPKKIPQRMCIGCQTMKDKNTLVRIVKAADGSIATDVTGKKPGRGAYLCCDSLCLEKSLKNRKLEKAFGITLNKEQIEEIRKGWEQIVARKS